MSSRTAVLALLPLLAFARPQQERYSLSGRTVSVWNIAGSVRVEHGTGSDVVVEVKRSGRDAKKLEIKTDAINGVPSFRVIYPADEIATARLEGRSSSRMEIADDGTFGRDGRRVDVRSLSRASRDALEADADLVVYVPDGLQIDVHEGVGPVDAQGVNASLRMSTSNGDITAANTRGLLSAHTASGEIKANQVDGDVDLSTASGDVEVIGASGEELSVHVASGGITTTGVSARSVDLSSASGGIRMSDARASEVKAHSASGSVRITLSGDVRAVDASTASGSVDLSLPANFGGTLEMSSSSGDLETDFPLQVLSQRRNSVRGTVGSGNASVRVSTASGGVRVSKN